MQFKYPELLWALLLLAIPIIIHLFQLRRFKKTPFTNVKLLKKVVSESRRSSVLKKWLILLARLGIFASLILAFAQPFSANENALKPQQTVIYLDNSFSMEAKLDNGTLLQNMVQEIIQNVPKNSSFSLLTNDRVFEDVEIADIQNELIDLAPSTNQLSLDQVLLRSATLFQNDPDIIKRTVFISDFQERLGPLPDTEENPDIYFIKQVPQDLVNVSIDSVYISESDNAVVELTAVLSSNETLESHPVSLYNGDNLIAKTAAPFANGRNASVTFSVPANAPIAGRIVISDTGLSYDNEFYFNLDSPKKIRVLAISENDPEFLRRIYGPDEFDFTTTPLGQVNYSAIEDYNLLVLNELEQIPAGLQSTLRTFVANGGSFVVIPAQSIDIASYNGLSASYLNTSYGPLLPQKASISGIAFEHPIYKNVFNKRVTNFQYPEVESFYSFSSEGPKVLTFQNGNAFLIGNENAFFFASALNQENSNFKNSPLIVPTFYNIARNSLKLPQLYQTLGTQATLEIPVSLSKDRILKVAKDDYEFIPQQISLPKKVQLTFDENPKTDGIFQISNGNEALGQISFNYDRKESELRYLDIDTIENDRVFDSIISFFEDVQKSNSVNEFWKWFAILALVFVLTESALQRFLK
ncbi:MULTISPECIES: BatA domain-containing protein [Maribacter]|uniref:BatA domain-containing protein n=1 Tax=Maribacter flavus TaxID=1658664 RepID=A0ABU7IJS6_9FLAO|nr:MULTISPECIES: BatA domain-containing protein [Maribacter]MDC6405815.1 BatA domain-containing protein [Maribacter sp. PR66]MEE1972933.1 BatA domain-containing protein [Maribacter flavus]